MYEKYYPRFMNRAELLNQSINPLSSPLGAYEIVFRTWFVSLDTSLGHL